MSTKINQSKIATARVVQSLGLALEFWASDSSFSQHCREAERADVLNALHELYDWLYLADEFWIDD